MNLETEGSGDSLLACDTLVVGAGIFGLLTAFFAAQKQPASRIVVCDRGLLGSGATDRSGALIRVFHENDQLIELTAASMEFWRRLGEQTPLVHWCGSLWLEPEVNRPTIQAQLEAIKARHPWYDCALLDQPELQRRFPSLRFPQSAFGMLETRAGYVESRQFVAHLRLELIRVGVLLLEQCPLRAIAPFARSDLGARWEAKLAQGWRLAARNLVIAAGPWTDEILRTTMSDDLRTALAIPGLRTKAIQTNRLRLEASPLESHCFVDGEFGIYGRPDLCGHVRIGVPLPLFDLDPSDPVSWEWSAARAQALAEVLPTRFKREPEDVGSHGGLLGLDAYSSDSIGFVKGSPRCPGLWVTGGWSGAGFKLAPAIARTICEKFNE